MEPQQQSEPSDAERELASRLAALDEAGILGTGTDLERLTAGLSPEVAERLGQALEYLARIRNLWPRLNLADEWPQPFGKFSLQRELGRGGHGVVFLAVDTTLGRQIALKIPRLESLQDPDLKHRFQREARAVAMLDHPGIVALLETGEVDSVAYMASKYYSGIDLEAWLKTRSERLIPRSAARLVAEVAEAVAHAHARGVVHRDLKPRNILIEETGQPEEPGEPAVRPRVTDFGLAKLLDADAGTTRTGLVIGTPRYMAPEQAQARHDAIGPPTDVYAIGAILEELLGGESFDSRAAESEASNTGELPARGVKSTVKPAKAPDHAPTALRAIVSKCLEQQPQHRYANAELLASDLRRFLAGKRVLARMQYHQSRLRGLIGHPVLAVCLAVFATMLLTVRLLRFNSNQHSGGLPTAPHATTTRPIEADQLIRVNRYIDDVQLAFQLTPIAGHVTYKLKEAQALLDRQRPGADEQDLRSLEWYHLGKALHGEEQTLTGHTGEVYWLTYSPDGRSLASAGVDGACIWDAATGTLRLKLQKHTDDVQWVSFSPDGKRLATASDDRTARVWSALDGSSVVPPLVHQHKVVVILFTSDGKTLITADRGGNVSLWNASTGARIRQFSASAAVPLEGMALSPDGKILATAASDQVRLWDYPSLEPRGQPIRIDGEGHRFDCVAFSRDGRRFATASGGEMGVRVWETSTAKLVFARESPGERVMSVAFSPDDHTLVSTLSDCASHLWDLDGHGIAAVLAGHTDWVWCAAFAPDGMKLATTGKDQTIKIWDISRGQMDRSFPPVIEGPLAIGHSADGHSVYIATRAGTCKRWNPANGGSLKVLPFSLAKPPIAAAFSPGSSIVAMVDEAGTLSVGSPDLGKPTAILRRAADSHPSLTFSGDGRSLALVARDGSVAHINTFEMSPYLERLESSAPAPNCLAYASEGRFIAGAVHRRLVVWDLKAAGRRVVSDFAAPEDITAVAISPDGALCATNGMGREFLLWTCATMRFRKLTGQNVDSVASLAFSKDGQTLVSGGSYGWIYLWNVATARQIIPIRDGTMYDGVASILAIAPGNDGIAAIVLRGDYFGPAKFLWRSSGIKRRDWD